MRVYWVAVPMVMRARRVNRCGIFTAPQLRHAVQAASHMAISLLRLPKEALFRGKARIVNELLVTHSTRKEFMSERDMQRILDLLLPPPPRDGDAEGESEGGGGGMGRAAAVSRSCACIGSLCLRYCMHGASIGGGDDPSAPSAERCGCELAAAERPAAGGAAAPRAAGAAAQARAAGRAGAG
jgi:hypothetical protein